MPSGQFPRMHGAPASMKMNGAVGRASSSMRCAMAHRMLELARPTAPFIFMDAGAPCIRGNCPEGKMTCGNPYPRVKRG